MNSMSQKKDVTPFDSRDGDIIRHKIAASAMIDGTTGICHVQIWAAHNLELSEGEVYHQVQQLLALDSSTGCGM